MLASRVGNSRKACRSKTSRQMHRLRRLHRKYNRQSKQHYMRQRILSNIKKQQNKDLAKSCKNHLHLAKSLSQDLAKSYIFYIFVAKSYTI
jgi:DNA-binding GntR family transcriptional regulator